MTARSCFWFRHSENGQVSCYIFLDCSNVKQCYSFFAWALFSRFVVKRILLCQLCVLLTIVISLRLSTRFCGLHLCSHFLSAAGSFHVSTDSDTLTVASYLFHGLQIHRVSNFALTCFPVQWFKCSIAGVEPVPCCSCGRHL